MINPHYVAYARVHKRSPDEQLKHDRIRWPGGIMCGFILWIAEKKQEFYKKHPECFLDRYTIRSIDKWTAFLSDSI